MWRWESHGDSPLAVPAVALAPIEGSVKPRKQAPLTIPVTILITGKLRNSRGQISQEVTSLLVRMLKFELCRPRGETLSSIRLLLRCLGYLSSEDPVVSQMSPIQRNTISTRCHLARAKMRTSQAHLNSRATWPFNWQ